MTISMRSLICLAMLLLPVPGSAQPDIIFPQQPLRPGQQPVSPWPPGTWPKPEVGTPRVVTSLADLEPTISVVVPGVGAGTGVNFQLAAPPIPDLSIAAACLQVSRDEAGFAECLVSDALPPAYRITRACIAANPADRARALLCALGRSDLMREYDRLRSVQGCARRSTNDWDVAECVGNAYFGQSERYYLGCVTSNRGNAASTAVCAIGRNLTPEQQVALACAVSTGPQPHAYAVCTGGQLFEREINKCWSGGILTDNGCFGPNNEYRRFWRGVDDRMRQALGPNSEAYKAFKLLNNNVLSPGANGEVVKAVNVAIKDLRNGAGPNNEFNRLGRELNNGLVSIGKRLGF